MAAAFLLYGATGYTGRLIARRALERNLRPILAGRNGPAVSALARELGLDARVVALDDAAGLDRALADTPVVLHSAGPYVRTSAPMVAACLRTGAHYLDLTGEMPVFAALADRDAEARARGVMLLPSVGFDVVPSDCLALHLKGRLPSAAALALAFWQEGPARMSRGTALSSIGMTHYATMARREGRLEPVKGLAPTRRVDFGSGPRTVTQLGWGDVFTAWYSTGIPTIDAYAAFDPLYRVALAGNRALGPVVGWPPVQTLLAAILRRLPDGPSASARSVSRSHVWGEVTDARGQTAVARLHGPDAYTWTADVAVRIVERVLDGEAPPGFQTPARAYGPDFVLETEGVTREDVV